MLPLDEYLDYISEFIEKDPAFANKQFKDLTVDELSLLA